MSTGTAIAVLTVGIGIVIIAIGAIAALLASMRTVGDERRQEILRRTGSATFTFTVALLAVMSAWRVVCAFALDADFDINPLSTLALIAIVYLAQLARNKQKLGG